MKKISLNFFGEEISINMPKDLLSLRNEISEKFMFDPSDAAEIVISYMKDFKKKILESEKDFIIFLKDKIGRINLDISKESKIYLKSMASIKKQALEDKEELEELLKKRDDLKAEIEKETKEGKNKITHLDKKIKDLTRGKLIIIANIQKDIKPIKREEKKNVNEIIEIEKKLGLPLTLKEVPIKENDKNISENEEHEKLRELLKKNTKCILTQETKFMIHKKKMDELDKHIKEYNKQKLIIIKSNQKIIKNLKEKEIENIKQIIDAQKKLGLPVTVKVPPKKEGFYFPKREIKLQTIKKLDEKKVSFTSENLIEKRKEEKELKKLKKEEQMKSLTEKINNIVEKMTQKLELVIAKEITKENIKLEKIQLSAKNAYLDLKPEDQQCISECYEINNNTLIDIKNLKKFIMERTKEITQSLVQKNEENLKKLRPIKKKIKIKMKENIESKEKKTKNEKEANFGIVCDGCNTLHFEGIRYICQNCPNFIYCQSCYEKNKESHGHHFKVIEKIIQSQNEQLAGKINPSSEKILHFGVTCNGCGISPIEGSRFKCTVCDNFDYCEKCEERFRDEHFHPFLKIHSPNLAPVYIKCEINVDSPFEKET